jgi:hypothetical protein
MRARPLGEALAARRDVIAGQWLARTLETYPERTRRFLAQEADGFRNPVGQALREALPALVDELLGGMDGARARALLDGIVRIRAVQALAADEAVGFVLLLRRIVREQLDPPPPAEALAALDERIDRMALLAFDLFAQCRERLREIRAGEIARRTAVLERRRVRS